MKKSFHVIVVLLVMTILFFVGFNIKIVEEEIQENQYVNLVNDLSVVTQNFELWIEEKKIIVETAKDVVDNFELNDIAKYNTNNPYLNINNDDPDVSQVYIGLANGDFITGGEWVPPADYDPRNRTWYMEAKEANETIVSKVYIDRETGDEMVTVSSPLWSDDEFVGVVSVDVFLDRISTFLTNQVNQDNKYAFLVDYDGTFVMHTSRKSLIGQNIYNDLQDEALIELFEIAKASIGIKRIEYDFNGQEIRGIVQRAAGREWYISVALVNDNDIYSVWELEKSHLLINVLSLSFIFGLTAALLKNRRELNLLHSYLKKENEIDFLTGIYNRRFLNVYLENLWHERNAYSSISIFMMDVDNFKNYNDTYGHLMGDEVLKQITACVSDNIRAGDVFARFGGEEFALVLTNVPDCEVMNIGEKIRQSIYDLAIEHMTSQYERVTISIGITSVDLTDDADLSIRNTIEHADTALYEAKEKGRNSVVVYKPRYKSV